MDKKTILIVEGGQIAAMDLQQTLESLGYRVAGIARTGERAVEMADAARPDLILIDIDLAGAMTGIETAEQIARRHAIPVIYLADSADPELVGRAAKTRPYGYIVKPWNERDIRAEISIALYKSALEEAFRKEHADLEEWLRQRTEELRHADRELRRSEAWYRLIFERSGEGIFIFEAAGPDRGRFIDVNAAGLAIHGYTRDELLTMKITDLDVPENVQGAPARFEAILGGEWIAGETDHVRKDGTVFPVDFRAGLLELEGRPYVFTFLRDITERKAAERALRESELRSSTLLRAIPDMMFIIARDGTYRDFRVPDESELVVPANRIIGTNIRSSGFGGETTATILDHIARALETGELQVFEYGLDLPKGVRQYEARLVTLGGDEVLGIVRDITSRRQAEDALRESEEKYRTLFEAMLEGFAYCRMIYDDAGRPVDWEYLDTNRRLGELTGLTDIKGRRVLEAIPNIRELTPELFDLYGRVASTGIPERFEIDFKPLTMWLRVSVSSPKRGYFVAVFDDITGQKQAEEKVRRARDFYVKILDDFPNPIWRAGTDGKCDYFNRNWLAFTGRTLEQELGDGWAQGVHPEDLDRCLKIYRESFQARQPFAMEYRLRYHDGTYHWLFDSGKPFDNPDGEFAGFIGSCYDIEARVLAKEALRQSEEKYRSILENMQDLFYRTDMAGKITMLSPAGAHLAGYDSVDELIGMDASAIYAEPERRAELLRILEEKGSVTNFPLVLRVRNGSLRYVTASSHFYRDADGKIAGVEGILHDITGLKKTKDALEIANRKLNLLSSITRHDIRNQLMALKAYIELSTDSMGNSTELAGYLGKLEAISNTIERQIEFTRLYEDMGVRAPVWQNIEALVRDAASALPLGAVKVETDCHNLGIIADSLLGKVFYNLMDNALRYGGPAMTEIRVSAQETAGSMTIVVEDNGVGVPAEDKPRLFDRGFGKNTGLGLFLSREILAITGITITETGEPGHGARFGIVVPKGAWRISGAAEGLDPGGTTGGR